MLRRLVFWIGGIAFSATTGVVSSSVAVRMIRDRAPQPPVVSAHLPDGGISEGPDSAQVMVVEFGSMTCTYCKRFAREVLPSLKRAYVQTKRLQYRYVDVDETEAGRTLAALVKCRSKRVGISEARDEVFALAATSRAALIARSIDGVRGSEEGVLSTCMEENLSTLLGAQERSAGQLIGVRGTPSFLVGVRSGERVVGWLLSGFQSKIQLDPYIRRAEGLAADFGTSTG